VLGALLGSDPAKPHASGHQKTKKRRKLDSFLRVRDSKCPKFRAPAPFPEPPAPVAVVRAMQENRATAELTYGVACMLSPPIRLVASTAVYSPDARQLSCRRKGGRRI